MSFYYQRPLHSSADYRKQTNSKRLLYMDYGQK